VGVGPILALVGEPNHDSRQFSKSLAGSVPRRESLRRLGAAFAGTMLSTLGLGTAWARGPDSCAVFCKCRNKAQQTKCLAACKACKGYTSRISGACGSHVCCPVASCRGTCTKLNSDPNCGACGNNCHALGKTCCGGHCADLATDVFNCGSCGAVCAAPPPNESVACVSGTCVYDCVAGAIRCSGTCTPVNRDPDNCGVCGNVCGGSTPYCNGGECSECYPGSTLCDGVCKNLRFDNSNCGACGVVCEDGYICQDGCVPYQ
jgi:hypothetical protein